MFIFPQIDDIQSEKAVAITSQHNGILPHFSLAGCALNN
jgi:hypothetical protein